MASRLRQYFPMIHERETLLAQIQAVPTLRRQFDSWLPHQRDEFLDFCTGVRGVKLLYDSFFKEILNPEYTPERLNRLLSVLLGMHVTIKYVLPGDSTRIADESSLLIMDVVVELDLLQKYLFIPLDIFSRNIQNKNISNETEAWLAFLSQDEPDVILRLIEAYPEFRPMYEDVYRLCENVEKVMGMFSEELRILDRNTVQYMIDEMQAEIDSQKVELDGQKMEINSQKSVIDGQRAQLQEKDQMIEDLKRRIAELERASER